jgi:phage terminase large subunit-like protein
MGPASERLHAAIVEGRLKHLDDPTLNAHVRQAVAKDTPRGWRIDKLKSRDNIDGVVAMAMAIESAENKPAPGVFYGFV